MVGWLQWLAGFNMAIVGFAVCVTLILQSMVVELTDNCVADLDAYEMLEMCCFVASILPIFHATVSVCVSLLLGANKRIQEAVSRVWCRRIIFAAVILHVAIMLCLVCIFDALVFIKLTKFHCLGRRKYLVVAGDALAALLNSAFTVLASYVAIYRP